MHIQHDFHLHTTVSFCADESATIKNYFERFRQTDLKKIAFTDHFWDCSKAEPENEWIAQYDYPYLAKIKEEIKKEEKVPFKIYFGCEAEYSPKDGGLIITSETAEKFDFITAASSHTHHFLTKETLANPQKTAEAMVEAYEDIITCDVSRYIGSMAHPFAAIGTPYDRDLLYDMISDDCYLRLFEKTAEKGIAVEINTSCFRKMDNGTTVETYDADEIAALPYANIIRLAKKAGCQFVFGSDAHGIDEHEKWFPRADILAEIFEIKEHNLAEIVK
ncbi:MAG: PHP domain-containing protein [Ruminococcaceae bacterium]|nr:PHP domain-containing protein [Oscillospiraceae bacterium]